MKGDGGDVGGYGRRGVVECRLKKEMIKKITRGGG